MSRGVPAQIDEAAFRRDWLAGVRSRELAAKYGCCHSTLNLTAKRLGLSRRPAGRPRLDDGDCALTGGRWEPGRHGVLYWQAVS